MSAYVCCSRNRLDPPETNARTIHFIGQSGAHGWITQLKQLKYVQHMPPHRAG